MGQHMSSKWNSQVNLKAKNLEKNLSYFQLNRTQGWRRGGLTAGSEGQGPRDRPGDGQADGSAWHGECGDGQEGRARH